MGIRDHLLDDAITPFGISIDQPIVQSALFRVLDGVVQVATFLVAKGAAIRNQKLKIACVGAINIRVVDFVDDAVAEREPDTATGMIGSTDAFFGATRPPRFGARRTKRDELVGWVHAPIIKWINRFGKSALGKRASSSSPIRTSAEESPSTKADEALAFRPWRALLRASMARNL